jgi:thioredoxin reductase (NADPH)
VSAQPIEETPDPSGAFSRLSDADIARLRQYGDVRSVAAGELLFDVGEQVDDFLVILNGMVAIVEYDENHEEVIRVHGPGRFLGDLATIEGQPILYGARAVTDVEVLAVPRDGLFAAVSRDPVLGEQILRSYLIRRARLIETGTGIRIVGSRFSPDTRRLLQFAARNRIPHRLVDLDTDHHADGFVQSLGVSVDQTPLVVIGRDEVLRNPSLAEVAERLGLRWDGDAPTSCDLLVVGAGPAGLASAVYGSSDGLDVSIVDAWAAGGQAATSALIENYLGFPAGVPGWDLAERAIVQARKFGTEVSVAAEATSLRREDDRLVVSVSDGPDITALAVVVATGVKYNRLTVPGVERLEGTSVFYAATLHEAMVCSADPVAIVGGGNSAGQAALFLAGRVPKVTMVVREESLDEHMSRYLVTQIEQHPRIEVLLHHEVREARGDEVLREIVVVDNHDESQATIPARALFVFIGASPRTGWLDDTIRLDDKGFIVTGSEAVDDSGAATPSPQRTIRALETSMPGVFAAGDVRSGSVKRVTSAVGEGAMAIGLVHDYLGLSPSGQTDSVRPSAAEEQRQQARRFNHAS